MEQQGRWDAHRVSATAAPRALRHTPVRWRAVRPVPEPTTGVEPPSVPPHFAVDDPAWRVPISATPKFIMSVFTRNSTGSFATQRVHVCLQRTGHVVLLRAWSCVSVVSQSRAAGAGTTVNPHLQARPLVGSGCSKNRKNGQGSDSSAEEILTRQWTV
jgi:hypothetical protein